MLNRTAHSPFHLHPPSGWSITGTGVRGRKSSIYVACYPRRGTFLLLTAAIASCVFVLHSWSQLVAAEGPLRAPTEHSLGAPTEDINASKQVLPAAAPWMRRDGEKATAVRRGSQSVAHSAPREASGESLAGAPQRHMPESEAQFWRQGLRGAPYPKAYPGQSLEGIQTEKALEGTEEDDVKAGTDVFERLRNEVRQAGQQETEGPFAWMSGSERLLPKAPGELYPAEGAHKAEYAIRKEKVTEANREAAKQEGGTILEDQASMKEEAKEEVERSEEEEDHEEGARMILPSAARKRSGDYEGKHEEHEGVEKGKQEEEAVEKKKEKEGKLTEEKEKEKQQSSKESDAMEDKGTDGKEKEKQQSSKRSGDIAEKGADGKAQEKQQSSKRSDDIAEKAADETEKEKRPPSSKRSDDIVEKGGKGRESVQPVPEKEGRHEERTVHSVYPWPFFSDYPFCLLPNSQWCNVDLTTQEAKSAGSVPDFIRRANAFVSSMLPLPFFYIPLSIPRFWSGEEPSSVEPGVAARCRFTFTIDPMGPSEEIRLYVIPSQRRIGLTAARNLKHSEKGKAFSGMYGTETRMHAVSSFAQGCRVSEKLWQAGLIGWSYAGKTDKGVRILVTFPSEAHAKELVERKELSEKSYKAFVDEEGLDLLTPSEKCVLSGRTQNECEQLKAEAGQKRPATITISTDGYAENEVRIPEFVYESRS